MHKALVIDDSHAMRAFVRAALEAERICEVQESPTGFHALKLLATSSFDVVVVDVNMPDVNGLEVLSFIKKLIQTYVAGDCDKHRSKPFVTKVLDLGAYAFLSKPFTPKALAALVNEALSASNGEEGHG
ncbi:MAG: response regulator [Polyangiales bacterium]